jgi:hypothetical protein
MAILPSGTFPRPAERKRRAPPDMLVSQRSGGRALGRWAVVALERRVTLRTSSGRPFPNEILGTANSAASSIPGTRC